MKTKIRSAALVAIASAVAFIRPVCAEETPTEIQATFVEPTSPEAKSYRAAGEYAIDRLVMTMVTDCAAAVAHQTEVGSLATFHLKDVPLKNGTVAGLPRIPSMKLTAEKLRNPANAPDAAEKLALAKVRAGLNAGIPPEILVQKIELPNGKTEWRVYKPLANIRQCGTCHEAPEKMSAELRDAIARKYPDDQATGFTVGTWRGLIRVTVGEPVPPPAAKATKS